MANGVIPKTIEELYYYCQGKFAVIEEELKNKMDNIESKINDIERKPDITGKWIVRIFLILNSIATVGLLILNYIKE